MRHDAAALELRQKLAHRLHALADQQTARGHALRCTIAVDSMQFLAAVNCADPADQSDAWRALHPLLVAGAVTQAQAHLCFSVSGPSVAPASCEASPQWPGP